MKNLKQLSEIIFFLLILGAVSLVGSISILAKVQDDPHNCQLSPDNQGCSLNRPTDVTAKANKNTSFQFVYNEQDNTIRLVKVNYQTHIPQPHK